MIDLNVRALTELSLSFVDSLERHRGGILNVASIAAFLPGPGMAVYYASKAYVLSFSEALHRELAGRGIRVTALCPGPVQTEFQARSGMKLPDAAKMIELPARRVAQLGYDGLMRGRRVVIAGIGNKIAVLPDALYSECAADGGRRSPHGLCRPAMTRGFGAPFASRYGRVKTLEKRTNRRRHATADPASSCTRKHSTPGRIGNALRDLGYPLDVRRPRFEDPLPSTMAEHAGAIIFGGPMSANDPDDFIRREIDWIGVPLKERKPFLGICLGAQMFARQLGGKVFRHPEGHAEIGYYPIRPTGAGLAVVDAWPECVYQWHREGFDLPPGAELLAEGDTFEVQAIRAGSGFRAAIPPRRDPRHDAQMDDARPRAHGTARRKTAAHPFRRPRRLRLFGARLAQRVSGALACGGVSAAAATARFQGAGRNRRPSWYRPATSSTAAAPGNWRCLRPRAGHAASRSL